ncbi:unnamed protein product, partial [Allacma fusca]
LFSPEKQKCWVTREKLQKFIALDEVSGKRMGYYLFSTRFDDFSCFDGHYSGEYHVVLGKDYPHFGHTNHNIEGIYSNTIFSTRTIPSMQIHYSPC